MKNNIKRFCVFSAALLFVFKATIAGDLNPIKVLSTDNGLPSNEVKQLYQDKEGYVWMATANGLCRYDGYEIKVYKSNLYTPNLLVNNYIQTVVEDNNHNIWIGTSNGLNVYNKDTGEIRKFENKKVDNTGVQSLLADNFNNVWIGTFNGLMRYNTLNDTFIYYNTKNTNYQLRGNDVKTLLEDNEGNIWIGCWNAGITRFNIKENKFYAYPKINPENSAHVLFQDNAGRIWVGSWGHGLFYIKHPYELDKIEYVNYQNDKHNPNTLSDNIVYAISQDIRTGYLWVGTRSGLSVLEQKDKSNSFKNFLPNNPEGFLNYNEVNSIISDKTGFMWLGTVGGGVSIINTKKSVFNHNQLSEVKDQLQSNSVRSIYVDANENTWIGIGSYGLVKYNQKTKKYTYFGSHSDFKENPINSTVNQITQIQNSSDYWIATYGQGVYIYTPKSTREKLQILSSQAQSWLKSDCVFYMKEDKYNLIWFGTADGLCMYDPIKKEGVSYTSLNEEASKNKRYVINQIEEGQDGELWLATSGDGLIKAIRSKETRKIARFKQYTNSNGKINNDNIVCLYKDSNGKIWSGAEGGGLSFYDKQSDKFISVQRKYNIPGDIVNSIVEDNKSNLWLGTNTGLVEIRFTGKSGADSMPIVIQYTNSDGLQDNFFNRGVVFKKESGELFFGGHKGYNHFYPDSLFEKNTKSKVVVTDIKIYNKSLVALDENLKKKISEKAAGYTSHINLPYNYNNITLEFSALNYSNPMQNSYAYKLRGFDKEWHYTQANRRYASYNNLKRGSYNFVLKASIGNGQWNYMGYNIEIKVQPAPWFTWWAFLIYAIIFVIIIQQSVKIARGKIALKDAIKVMDIEKQKSNELNHAKLKFFTNITHEFLTPLTILSASVDELKISNPQKKDFYQVMTQNINRLIRLLQQVLEFRKAETGNLKLKVSKGNIAEFMKIAVDSFKPLMKKNKMHFSLICEPEEITGYFDQDKLDKIIYNLLSNASKYNKKGGFVQVNLCYDEEDENTIAITVKDNGEGIESQVLGNLFERFYEGDYRKFKTFGTGIGLSLTKDLVVLHKGEINVESTVGVGTCFRVKIPISNEAYSEDEIDNYSYISEAVELSDTGAENTQNKNVKIKYSLLLVEDNEELLQLLVKLLEAEYNIHKAANGRQGIEILQKEYIDLAISDVMMPEMNGIEFCKYVKNDFEMSHVPIILLTAKNKEEDRVEAYNSGADGFISKPFNLYVLKSKINNLLKAKERKALEFKKHYKLAGKEVSYTSIDEEFLNRAIKCVHDHIGESEFDQQQFAVALKTSKSTLYKKLKSLTGLNTSSFIRNIRLKTACNILHKKKKIRISELAYTVGFNDPKYFSACFKKEFGLLPSEYLDKISKET